MKYIWDRYIFSQKSDILLLQKYERVLYCAKSAENYAFMSQFSPTTFSKEFMAAN
jgi:hypothetical protein